MFLVCFSLFQFLLPAITGNFHTKSSQFIINDPLNYSLTRDPNALYDIIIWTIERYEQCDRVQFARKLTLLEKRDQVVQTYIEAGLITESDQLAQQWPLLLTTNQTLFTQLQDSLDWTLTIIPHDIWSYTCKHSFTMYFHRDLRLIAERCLQLRLQRTGWFVDVIWKPLAIKMAVRDALDYTQQNFGALKSRLIQLERPEDQIYCCRRFVNFWFDAIVAYNFDHASQNQTDLTLEYEDSLQELVATGRLRHFLVLIGIWPNVNDGEPRVTFLNVRMNELTGNQKLLQKLARKVHRAAAELNQLNIPSDLYKLISQISGQHFPQNGKAFPLLLEQFTEELLQWPNGNGPTVFGPQFVGTVKGQLWFSALEEVYRRWDDAMHEEENVTDEEPAEVRGTLNVDLTTQCGNHDDARQRSRSWSSTAKRLPFWSLGSLVVVNLVLYGAFKIKQQRHGLDLGNQTATILINTTTTALEGGRNSQMILCIVLSLIILMLLTLGLLAWLKRWRGNKKISKTTSSTTISTEEERI